MFNGVLQDDAEKSVGAFFKMLANSDGCVWQCLSLEKNVSNLCLAVVRYFFRFVAVVRCIAHALLGVVL